ncbi:MAG: hypothetical protein ACI8WT_003849 [Clostridium sp.]|jgi:hypothetical protein
MPTAISSFPMITVRMLEDISSEMLEYSFCVTTQPLQINNFLILAKRVLVIQRRI